MLSAPILAFAAIDGVARIKMFRWSTARARLATQLALASLLATTVLTVAINPLAELGTYVSSTTAADIESCLDVIPSNASVAATQNLLAHLSTRRHVYQIPIQNTNGSTVDPVAAGIDYIAIDIATEGNDSRFRDVVRSAFSAGYGVVCTRELTAILRKGASSQTLTPQLDRWLAGSCAGRACLLTD
jgi:hypothetical protein